MSIRQLLSALSRANVDLPPQKMKKSFYVDLYRQEVMAINKSTERSKRESKEKREERSASSIHVSRRSSAPSDRKRKRSTSLDSGDEDGDDNNGDSDSSSGDDTRSGEKRQRIGDLQRSAASPPNIFQRARESLPSSLLPSPIPTTAARDSSPASSILNRDYSVQYRSVIDHLECMLQSGDQMQMARYHWELQTLYRLISDWRQWQQQQQQRDRVPQNPNIFQKRS